MSSTRRLALPALALAAVLGVSACGSEDSTSTPAAGSADVQFNDVDVQFLTGMVPHHEQAVEMADMVLDAEADAPAEVVAIAREIKAAQDPEIEQMEQMLDELGVEESAGGGHGGGHGGSGGGHGGMMSEADMEALDDATGTEAARLFLEGMVEHHEGAIEASDTEIEGGEYEPAIELAQEIKAAQQAEITEMRELLAQL